MKFDFYSLRGGYLRITLVVAVLAGIAFVSNAFITAETAGVGSIIKTIFGGAGTSLAVFVGLWMLWMGCWIVMWVSYFIFTLAGAGLSKKTDQNEPEKRLD